ncbi:hypothetical protein AB0M43_23945 [Longispora sp. NPDC051575]|uniref:Mom family adenine methylcarbamoylation protein n=1 Tax=Longispora sp. NPDC051575 TaxID=3154943 RepID=UPI003413C38E
MTGPRPTSTDAAGWCQRWLHGRQSWRHRSEPGGFDRDRYAIVPVDYEPARRFVTGHHYSATWPVDQLRYGLLDVTGPAPSTAELAVDGQRLVGVIVLGVPMNKAVLTGPFPTLVPYRESMDLARLVLLDEVPANAETFFTARALRLAAGEGVRGLTAYADPTERLHRLPDGTTVTIKRGHLGYVYQAGGWTYLGRSKPRPQILLPDGTVLNARAIAKVTGGERGQDAIIHHLRALGATEPRPDRCQRSWLDEALNDIGAHRERHTGCHKYAIRVGRNRAERTSTPIPLSGGPYPKHNHLEPR